VYLLYFSEEESYSFLVKMGSATVFSALPVTAKEWDAP